VTGTIRIGTTSWSEKTLLTEGHFYPDDVTTPEARLRYYASQFPVTEVDSSYYGLLSEHNAKLWTERTPEGFVFDVKAFRLFTYHRTPLSAFPADLRAELGSTKKSLYYEDVPEPIRLELWQRFRSALEPLRAANRLGAVLFQLAPWFVFRRKHLDHVALCAERMEGFHVAIEARNKTWFDAKHCRGALDFEEAHHLVNVVVDEPQGFANSVPPVWEVTDPHLAIVRLHGRNAATWNDASVPSAAERFGYLYDDRELSALAAPIRGLADRAEEVHVLFNNCYRDNAQLNAARLREILRT
jgi:uncharacterized protein YecE (DUF72 family)